MASSTSTMAVEEEQFGSAEQKIRHVLKAYTSGKLFFPRHLLEDLSRQIDQGSDEVHIADLDGVPQKHSLKVPSCIQSMTAINPFMPDEILQDQPPVAICYTRQDRRHENPLEEVHKEFVRQREVWQTSEACESLQKQLATLALTRPIKKIVCFALGTMDRLNTRCATRSHMQHAAVETVAEALKKRQNHRSDEIQCFAQDPAYDDVDLELLRIIGITRLEDPKGFLEIDEATFVFSVSPNVPVKQIVADVQWPAAMLWNTVRPCEPDVAKWQKRVKNGEITWVCPYTTDPDSSRVRRMVGHYEQATVFDTEDWFGDLTLYMR
ncbi:SRR1 family protein [Aspergillus clavatus NRRL 1]|uniref:SRR1-like domain-containing protein n=1 Tax=Aspergillus clavatus (strain ATCC 1007 / CBS 513.65 / DSM 816 / NCTC 3887 / NRRL 1 / QM 1276 / 107) TaxID=344612 RepID=A1CGC2_ASPCL|nr:uncharacterized protein ACLA_066380 [Aspergillus clavatus NRRL 1]EAW11002.1 conserved hypothetical protein [Aspergillus clavatus NRRL 1]